MSRLLDDPKRVQALVASFLSTQRTTRNNVNPYFIPPDITMEEHYQLAMDSGMDPREYDRRNYHGTSSSQPFPHLAHILPPRHFPLPKTVKQTTTSDLNISAPNPAETLPAKRLHSQTTENVTESPTSQPLLNPLQPQDSQPTTLDDRASPKSGRHLDLGEVMVKKPRYPNKSISMGKPMNQFRDPKRPIQQLSMADLDSIHSPSVNSIWPYLKLLSRILNVYGKVRSSYNINWRNPEVNCRTRNGMSNSCVKN